MKLFEFTRMIDDLKCVSIVMHETEKDASKMYQELNGLTDDKMSNVAVTLVSDNFELNPLIVYTYRTWL